MLTLINAVRGHLAEFGLVARRGARNIRELAELVRDTGTDSLPDAARAMLVLLLEQIREAQIRVRKTEHALEAWAKRSDACRRLMAIPGVGTMSATALVLVMDDPKRFRRGRLTKPARPAGDLERPRAPTPPPGARSS